MGAIKKLIAITLLILAAIAFIQSNYLNFILYLVATLLIPILFPRKKILGEGETGPVRKEIKDKVMQIQRGICATPGCYYKETLVLHHILPRHMHGDNRYTNLQYLCPNCHAQAHKTRRGTVSYAATPHYLRGAGLP